MTDNELKETIKNLEIGNSTMRENEYVKIRKNVLESILTNYKELLKLRELQKPNMRNKHIYKFATAKKPIEICEFAEDDLVGLCPWCNDGVTNEMNYCINCGQALDWSD